MKSIKLMTAILATALLVNGSSYTASVHAADTAVTVKSLTGSIVSAPNQPAQSDKADANVISLVDSQEVTPVGQSSTKIWTFDAKKSGTYQIVFTYSRPWEKDSKDIQTVTYRIKVSKKSTTNKDIVVLSEDKVNTLKKNQQFSISLEQNASTGYSWSYTTNKKALPLASEEVQQPDGAPYDKAWTFRADKAGTYKIIFTNSRAWEKEDKDAKTVTYTVKVTGTASTSDNKSAIAIVNDKENTLTLGQMFVVTLEENASTGYTWSYQIVDNADTVTN